MESKLYFGLVSTIRRIGAHLSEKKGIKAMDIKTQAEISSVIKNEDTDATPKTPETPEPEKK